MSLAALELDLEVFTGPFDLLLELYKRGEADWQQEQNFGEIAVRARTAPECANGASPAAEPVRAIAG